jgi:hypothetical protein
MLHTLPDAILQVIFEQLSAPQLLALRFSCKTFARLLSPDDLWKTAWKVLEPRQPLHQLAFQGLGSRYDAYSLWRHQWWLDMQAQGVNAHGRAAKGYLALAHNLQPSAKLNKKAKSEHSNSHLITSEPILENPGQDDSRHSTHAHTSPQANPAHRYLKKQPTWSPTGKMIALVTRQPNLAVPTSWVVIVSMQTMCFRAVNLFVCRQ